MLPTYTALPPWGGLDIMNTNLRENVIETYC